MTPSLNQGQFLAEAIDSVLSQTYRYFQYAIIDGGSSDNSIDIIKRYEKYLSFWVSDKDNGQSNAINKGLKRLKGDVWSYLNSDDAYTPGTFAKVVDAFAGQDVKWVTGRGVYVDESGAPVREMKPVRDWNLESVLERLISDPILMAVQVSNFMATSVIERFGYFDESLHYAMDVEFGLRPLLAGIRPVVIDEVLGRARLHPASKTVNKGKHAFPQETALILQRLLGTVDPRYRPAILTALCAYERQQALTMVRQIWERSGRTSGMLAWARAARVDPGLIRNSQALGLLRRIIGGEPS